LNTSAPAPILSLYCIRRAKPVRFDLKGYRLRRLDQWLCA